MDVDRNEILSMRVYPSRNILTTKQFIHEVLNYCIGKPIFIVDNAPWLNRIRGAGINIQYRVSSDRSLIESVYSSFNKEQGILQQHNIKPNK